MMLKTNDATARMIESFKKNDGKDTLANLALMWADWYSMKTQMVTDGLDDIGEYTADGLYLLTTLVKNVLDDE